MPDGMIQKERKKRIIKQAAMKAILVIILVCIAMITFLLLFQVRKIEISGNQYLSRQEIADWVQDDNWSSNSLYVMIRNHLMNHELLPAMEEANVTMKNPWTVKVTIKEKRVAGYIVSGDECIYFDKDGIVLAKTKELWDGIPCIEGLEVKKVQLYKALPVSKANKKAFKSLLEISTTLAKYELVPTSLSVVDSEVYLYFGNKCVILGHENIENRIAQITPILEKLGDQKGTLHLEDYNEKNTTISFEKDFLPSDEENTTENAE